jgi:hypothetical protein
MTTRERNLLIGLGGIVVVAAAVFLLTRGGGEPEEAAPAPPAPPPVAPPLEPTPRPPRIPVFFAARDPFVPLVVDVTAEAPTDGAPDGAPDGDGGQPPVDGGQPPVQPPTGDGDQPGVSVGGHNVVVVDVFMQGGREVVQVTVDGETFTVGEGDRFANNFEVVSIEGECATFLFGDEQFTACEGGRPK